jgi:hypothetical protein
VRQREADRKFFVIQLSPRFKVRPDATCDSRGASRMSVSPQILITPRTFQSPRQVLLNRDRNLGTTITASDAEIVDFAKVHS